MQRTSGYAPRLPLTFAVGHEIFTFNVSGESRTVDEWKSDVENVVGILQKKYPNLQDLYLQPVIGGVDERSNVRAVKNHPQIVEAIIAVVDNSRLVY